MTKYFLTFTLLLGFISPIKADMENVQEIPLDKRMYFSIFLGTNKCLLGVHNAWKDLGKIDEESFTEYKKETWARFDRYLASENIPDQIWLNKNNIKAADHYSSFLIDIFKNQKPPDKTPPCAESNFNEDIGKEILSILIN